MSENIEKSSSLNRIVEDITHLKRRLESFERHVYNTKSEEVKKEYYDPWPGFWTQKKHYVISRWYSMTGRHEVPAQLFFIGILRYL
jgi:hypothetical protein